uniref:Uncharacterized protein n=1 Tax=Panagrolaimus davidi TaxID=227884 RepID=A0A914R054_9BILA
MEKSPIFLFTTFCFFFALFIFSTKADVCNQLTSNLQITTPLDGISLYNWTGQFTINQTSDGYKIYLVKGANNSADPVNIYANESIGADYDWRKWGSCTEDKDGCYWFTKAGEFSPYLEFTTGFETLMNLYVAHTYVDDGYFGESSEMVFTNTNNYYDYNVDYGDYRAQYQVTCDYYIPVPPATIPSKSCTIFSHDAVVYDTTQNFKIITSVSAIVNVSNNNIGFITGIAKGPDDLISGIYMNADVEALP